MDFSGLDAIAKENAASLEQQRQAARSWIDAVSGRPAASRHHAMVDAALDEAAAIAKLNVEYIKHQYLSLPVH